MSQAPIPCAHCRGRSFAEPPSLGRSHWNVVCDDCGASGPHGHDEGQAIRRWNERISPDGRRMAETENTDSGRKPDQQVPGSNPSNPIREN